MNGEREKLAIRAVELARADLVAQNPFLASAIGRLRLLPGDGPGRFETDGRSLAFNVKDVLDELSRSGFVPTRELLHVVLHCVLLHPFQARGIDPRLWDLACDICVERLCVQLAGPREDGSASAIGDALRRVQTSCGGNISAQRVYRRLQDGAWRDATDSWPAQFVIDYHEHWYRREPLGSQAEGEAGFDPNAEPGAATEEGEAAEGASVGREIDSLQDEGDLREEWKRIARRMRVAIESMPRDWGKRAGVLAEEVVAAARGHVDYAAWLRQFAAIGEHLRLSDEEYDPVFYTFGLRRYGNLPLIEPLEQREERRIREFVIVIDTSQSVSGEAVRRFVDETCAILKSTETFAREVQVRILQCDTKVQSDERISSISELEDWGSAIELCGFGGTDFRPAFAYVDDLLEKGELSNLGGLVYFTDGWGTYPERRPSYPTAFAFYDDDHRAEEVPPWAVQLVLNDDDIGKGSKRVVVPVGGVWKGGGA